MDSNISESFNGIFQKIITARKYGKISTGVDLAPTQKQDLIRDYLNEHGFHVRDKADLSVIDRDEALTILAALLHKDMAYSSEMIDLSKSYELATEFIDLFGDKTEFYSNGMFSGDKENQQATSWNPITEATFDSGVIGIGDGVIAYVWFEDED